MKLLINHQTHYEYSHQASQSVQYIKMTPQSNLHQQVHHWNISVPGDRQQRLDAFGNVWITSSQDFAYQQFTVMAQGLVEIRPDHQQRSNICLNSAPTSVFLQQTLYTQCNIEMLKFASYYVRDKTLLEFTALSAAVLAYMPYQANTTLVTHTAIESFQEKLGVCQDHSHVFIAMCRALAVPARYVSGYLYVANAPHLASHAWAEIYLEGQWHSFDISNQTQQLSNHVYVAIGRDYGDVAPIRGMRASGGTEIMSSSVQVLSC